MVFPSKIKSHAARIIELKDWIAVIDAAYHKVNSNSRWL
jgi:hypothetical protein